MDQDGGASGTAAAPTDKVDAAAPAVVPDNSPNVQVVVVSKLQVSCSHEAFHILETLNFFEYLDVLNDFYYNHKYLQ